jgi:Ni,Fe-hydrogenase maturation factor
MTHHLDPAGLVGLARELWGAAPPVVIVSVGVSSLDVGDRLSPVVERAVPHAADAVVAIVEGAIVEGAIAGAVIAEAATAVADGHA